MHMITQDLHNKLLALSKKDCAFYKLYKACSYSSFYNHSTLLAKIKMKIKTKRIFDHAVVVIKPEKQAVSLRFRSSNRDYNIKQAYLPDSNVDNGVQVSNPPFKNIESNIKEEDEEEDEDGPYEEYNLKEEDLFRIAKIHDILNERASVQNGEIADPSNSSQEIKIKQEALTKSETLQHVNSGMCIKLTSKVS